MKLNPVICPECGDKLESAPYSPNPNGRPPRASGFDSCLRKCSKCGIGLSNARTPDVSKLTPIYRDPFRDVPDQRMREYCDEVLANAFNVNHRPQKKTEFQSSKSEDHVCWVIFRYLQLQDLLAQTFTTMAILNGQVPEKPTLLLWGAPVPPGDDCARELSIRLEAVSKKLGENQKSRSEPDVILDFKNAGLVLIEAKHKSRNEWKKADYKGWPMFLRNTQAIAIPEDVRQVGLYELTRNWRIGWDLAEGRPFRLINLGPASLFAMPFAAALSRFEKCLNTVDDRKFVLATWCDLVAAITSPPPWLQKYLRERGVV